MADYSDATDPAGSSFSSQFNTPPQGYIWNPITQQYEPPSASNQGASNGATSTTPGGLTNLIPGSPGYGTAVAPGTQSYYNLPASGGPTGAPNTPPGYVPPAYGAPSATPATPPGTGGSPSALSAGGVNAAFPPFTTPFTAPTPTPLPSTPVYTPPSYTPPPAFSYPDFTAPTLAQAEAQPGYQFTLNQGEQALQQSAAAAGTLNTGGTLKDILNYGQAAATTNYGNVFNQDLQTYNTNLGAALGQYNTNYQTQYTDPYQFATAAAQAQFAPQMTGYTTQASNVAANNTMANTNAYNAWLQDFNIYNTTQDNEWNRIYASLTAT